MFALDSRFYRVTTWLYRVMVTNLLFIVVSLPLVTLAPAFSALVATLKDGENPHLVKPFLTAFKTNFWRSLPLGIFNLFSAVFMLGLLKSNLQGLLTLKLVLIVFGLFLLMYNLNLYLIQLTFHYAGYLELFQMTFFFTLMTVYKLVWPLLLFAVLYHQVVPHLMIVCYLFLISGPLSWYIWLYQREMPRFTSD
ncbi:DUF624 domain-containing protein [Enterococcus sp.]|uniref:DUF624 domain-containing protein n=1 Tax=Enterococcus sp. TaxID=35783 RepID=UPI003C73F771